MGATPGGVASAGLSRSEATRAAVRERWLRREGMRKSRQERTVQAGERSRSCDYCLLASARNRSDGARRHGLGTAYRGGVRADQFEQRPSDQQGWARGNTEQAEAERRGLRAFATGVSKDA